MEKGSTSISASKAAMEDHMSHAIIMSESHVKQVRDDSEPDSSFAWSQKEERSVLWKLDLYLLPLLVLGFFVLQLDRSNISNALTNTIKGDLGLSQSQVNAGSSLMLAGIVIFELPSNYLLQRVGAPIWLTFQLMLFGLVSITQAWCTNSSSFLATRFVLGMCEAGYIPGAQYVLALFYCEKELALRTAIFYFGNYFATATGSLIAAGVLGLDGNNGLAGWQWLFIIEGSITLFAFLLFFLFLPWSPEHTEPIHGRFGFFTNRERRILQARLLKDDSSKRVAKADVTFRSFLDALIDYRLWAHLILNLLSLTPKGGLQLYAPSIIKALGFSSTRANLLNSVSSFIVVFLSFFISLASDLTHMRGPWCLVSFMWSIVFSGAMFGLPVHAGKWTKYAVFTLLMSGNALAQGLNDSWLNINARSASHRSVGLAFVVMGSNLGGLAGAKLFQASDSPRYTHAWLAILLLYAASMVVTCLLMLIYWRDNKKQCKSNGDGPSVTRKFQI